MVTDRGSPHLDAADRALVAAALDARTRAYAPYSRYLVGAAVRTAGGGIHTGCNVEISSFSHTCCAERVAVFKAVSEGERDIVAVAVATDDDPPVTPCGACRQVLYDFGRDMRVVLANTAGGVRVTTLRALLPDAFVPDRVLAHMRAPDRGPGE